MSACSLALNLIVCWAPCCMFFSYSFVHFRFFLIFFNWTATKRHTLHGAIIVIVHANDTYYGICILWMQLSTLFALWRSAKQHAVLAITFAWLDLVFEARLCCAIWVQVNYNCLQWRYTKWPPCGDVNGVIFRRTFNNFSNKIYS